MMKFKGLELRFIDLLKIAFYLSSRSLTISDLNKFFKIEMNIEINQNIFKNLLNKYLKKGYIEKTSSLLYMKYQSISDLDNLYNELKNNKDSYPISNATSFYDGNKISLLNLIQRDSRFLMLSGNKSIILSEWEIVNDDVYQLLEENEISYLHLDYIYNEICNNSVGLNKVFLLEYDKRFILSNDKETVSIKIEDKAETPFSFINENFFLDELLSSTESKIDEIYNKINNLVNVLEKVQQENKLKLIEIFEAEENILDVNEKTEQVNQLINKNSIINNLLKSNSLAEILKGDLIETK
ncbi:hypothetical protein [Metabacillus dongyingensis]|uniref:hypothetical protein n=1 Tax=Metabacillus dongyingensis TaxID=2874282 RepID=UPI001CBCF393|nr:hypothetical protein [Metabacillus dongyingensis]UAL53603.1 hypothetical protein K8L98_07415 [Metabacillus dongyingensis]